MKFVIILIVFAALAVSAQNKCPPRCKLAKDDGMCADAPSSNPFYYDSKTKQCKRFFYTGCGGNANRFKTKQLCQQKCAKPCSKTGTTTSKPSTTKKTTTTKKSTTAAMA